MMALLELIFHLLGKVPWVMGVALALSLDLSTTSSNILHPSATVLCPSDIIMWPAATFFTTTTECTVNTFSSTSSTFISMIIINTLFKGF